MQQMLVIMTGIADCRCDEATVARYVVTLSGPLLDRIDLHVGIARAASTRSRAPRRSNPR